MGCEAPGLGCVVFVIMLVPAPGADLPTMPKPMGEASPIDQGPARHSIRLRRAWGYHSRLMEYPPRAFSSVRRAPAFRLRSASDPALLRPPSHPASRRNLRPQTWQRVRRHACHLHPPPRLLFACGRTSPLDVEPNRKGAPWRHPLERKRRASPGRTEDYGSVSRSSIQRQPSTLLPCQ